MLTEPGSTQYDLHFRIAGVPVRVHPFFWLAALILGANLGDGPALLVWIAVVFVSILAHELGHAAAFWYFGQSPRIILYAFGGLATADGVRWSARPGTRGHWRQLIISAAGPAAGFLLAALAASIILAMGGRFTIKASFPVFWDFDLGRPLDQSSLYVYLLFHFVLWVNIFWGLINLLPIHPLDGGQIARELFCLADPVNGWFQSLWLSVFTAGALALWGFVGGDWFLGMFFALLAYSSYQAVQRRMGPGGW